MKDNPDQYFIIRCDRAGIFFAQIASRDGSEAELVNCRRIYSWVGAASISQVATDGVSERSEITVTVPKMTVLGVIEIIPASDKVTKQLLEFPAWKR
jgi:hypothetical protein